MIRVQPIIGGHGKVIWDRTRSQSVFFLPITRDRMKMETRRWCQTTWLVKPFRKIGMLTYLSHDLTLEWSDLRPDFEIDLSRSKSTVHAPNRLDEANTIVSFSFSYLSYEIANESGHISHDSYLSRHWLYCEILWILHLYSESREILGILDPKFLHHHKTLEILDLDALSCGGVLEILGLSFLFALSWGLGDPGSGLSLSNGGAE